MARHELREATRDIDTWHERAIAAEEKQLRRGEIGL
jgi:hypothetical protein